MDSKISNTECCKKERKRIYNKPILKIENGLFSTMVFAVNDVMELACNVVFSRIAALILIKKDIPKSVTINFKYTKISFCSKQY